MNSKKSNRRRFLKEGAALAGFALGTIRSASGQSSSSQKLDASPSGLRLYGERSAFERSALLPLSLNPSFPAFQHLKLTPLQDSVGYITPSSLHYVTTHGYAAPDIDPQQHRLMIHGMVDRPLILTVEELKRLPSVTRSHFVECAGNSSPSLFRLRSKTKDLGSIQQRFGLTSNSIWTGVPLSLLLKEAGLQNGASWLIAEGAEAGKHTKSIPIEKALYDVLVVYGQNGEAVRPEQGYPLRLLVPGWEGVSNVKWLRRIKVVDQPYMAKVETSGYVASRPNLEGKGRWFDFEMGPKSVITFPSDAHRLQGPGFYEISGLAWSGAGAIRRVEVSTDGGRTWKDAQLQEPVVRISHTRFTLPWSWNGSEAVLQSRCTDEYGTVQPSLTEMGKLWGVEKDWWLSTTTTAIHFNAIQPWKIARDGSIYNAMFT